MPYIILLGSLTLIFLCDSFSRNGTLLLTEGYLYSYHVQSLCKCLQNHEWAQLFNKHMWKENWDIKTRHLYVKHTVLDFKLLPRAVRCILSSGWFTSFCSLNANCSIFIGEYFIPTCLWRWNRQCSETLAFKLHTPVNHPEESIQQTHNFYLKTRWCPPLHHFHNSVCDFKATQHFPDELGKNTCFICGDMELIFESDVSCNMPSENSIML
jgi:hypothetical protein